MSRNLFFQAIGIAGDVIYKITDNTNGKLNYGDISACGLNAMTQDPCVTGYVPVSSPKCLNQDGDNLFSLEKCINSTDAKDSCVFNTLSNLCNGLYQSDASTIVGIVAGIIGPILAFFVLVCLYGVVQDKCKEYKKRSLYEPINNKPIANDNVLEVEDPKQNQCCINFN